MHYWMVNVFLVLVGDLTVTGYRQQVHPSIFERVHEPFSVEVDRLMPRILFFKLFTEVHDISIGERIGESEVCIVSWSSSVRLTRFLKTVAKGNAESIMIILNGNELKLLTLVETSPGIRL
jgi:hypothetical protein